METYKQFLDRISLFEKKEASLADGYFKVNPSLAKKVRKDNTFSEFYGDTVVFALDDGDKSKLKEYVDTLYRAVPQCFCERLGSNTFHVTLHDLSNSSELSDVAEEMLINEQKIVEAKRNIQERGKVDVRLKSKYIFNMVDTSLVLGLYPATERDYAELMELYSVIDGVKKLSYPFSPHITLAYYNVFGFDKTSAKALADVVNSINCELDWALNVNALYYQKFRSMNDYIDVVRLTK